MRRIALAIIAFTAIASSLPYAAAQQKTRDQKVREDRDRVTEAGFWIYNDLDSGFERARQTGKPLLVVLRCIPCEECVKLDDDLVDEDPVLRPLLEQFVCVRIVSTNGLDLSLFQFDTDQSFAVFMLNADRTIYGRFGTRSHRTEWIGDVSLKGLAEALNGALALHRRWPESRESLLAKTGPAPLFDHPENFPALRERYTGELDYSGQVARSCIHCHQIGDAVRDFYRSRSEPIPADIISPYPHPKSIGMILDPDQRSGLRDVTSGSPADRGGLKQGDRIESLNGQPLLSTADIQWVLNSIPATGGTLTAVVERDSRKLNLQILLQDRWKEADNIDWRVSAWGLSRMVLGGLRLEAVEPQQRGRNGIPESGMALRVRYVGQYNEHATAKRSGFQVDDVIVAFNNQNSTATESDVLRYGTTQLLPGKTIAVDVVRNGQKLTLQLPQQK